MQKPPLNQILYGPPGTGKTYATIGKAFEILGVNTENLTRKEQKLKFDEFRKLGQIEFITFHQSYSYEEFVEGIKPNIDDPENMIYKTKDGILKELSLMAYENFKAFKASKEDFMAMLCIILCFIKS